MKKLLSLILASLMMLTFFTACGNSTKNDPAKTPGADDPNLISPNPSPNTPSEPIDDSIKIYYDDRVTIKDLLQKDVSSYEIKDVAITSKAVGTTTLDTDLLKYDEESKTFTATATGSAIIVADGEEYTLKVLPAPLTVALIVGHSLGEGSQGNFEQSVKCELGQVYSSYLPDALFKNVDESTGLGTTAAKRPTGIDALCDGTGRKGVAGGLGYEWNKTTGEKIFVLNAAMGGSCANEWESTDPFHINAVKLLNAALKVVRNEVAAGHFEYKTTSVICFSSGNFYYKGVLNNTKTSLTNEEITSWYNSFWSGFQNGVTVDVNADGKNDAPESLGYVPLWEATQHINKFNYDKHAIYFMAASKDYPHVFIASHNSRNWQTLDGIKATFPAIDYETQSQPVNAPTKFEDVSADKVHLTQLGYNAQGQEIARNLYSYLRTENNADSVLLYNETGNTISSISVKAGNEYRFSVVVNPVSASNLEFTCSDNIEIVSAGVVKGLSAGNGEITISYNGEVIKKVTVKVN